MKTILLTALLILGSASLALADTATLTWTYATTGTAATGARIERHVGADPQVYSPVANVSAPTATFVQTGLTRGTRYCYRVIATIGAFDAAGPYPTGCGTPDSPINVNGLTIIFAPSTP